MICSALIYDSLTEGNVEGIGRFFDKTVTLITLSGSAFVNGPENIENIYRNIIETWSSKGLSSKIGYDRSQFVTKDAPRSGPRILDSVLSEISTVFQAACVTISKYTASGVRRSSAVCRRRAL